jgi:hypothetical protein
MKLKDKYNEYIKDWETKINSDEWYLYRFREEIINNSSPEEAFLLIPEVIELMLEEKDKFLCSEMLEFLIALARQSNTTEIPSVLEAKWTVIENWIINFDKYQQNRFKELKRWYRKE